LDLLKSHFSPFLGLTNLIFEQLCEHICLAKFISFCCFARGTLARRPKGVKQQEEINFAKQMLLKVVKNVL
jgi:hypothetical protein